MNRREFLRVATKTVLGVAIAGGGGYQYSLRLEPHWLEVEHVTVPLKQLPPDLHGFKIVHLSDFHLFPHTQLDLIQAAVNLANSLQPDLVALTGDFVLKNAKAIFELAPVLAQINSHYGIFSVLGNHDLWTNALKIELGLRQSKIAVFRNHGVTLTVGQARLNVAGLDDGFDGYPDLKQALADLPADVPTVLLMHEPDFVDQYALDGRVSLQLSGHTHGGQVRLPGLGALVLPKYGKKYQAGLYRVNDTWLYTNRGLGVISPPIRVNCRPEVTLLTLVSEEL